MSLASPNLCFVAAPLARDLLADAVWGPLEPIKLAGVATATLQLWALPDDDAATAAKAADPQGAGVTLYLSLAALPLAARVRLISVVRSDVRAVNPAAWVNPAAKTLQACGAGDYFVVRRSGAWASILKSEWNGATDTIPFAIMILPAVFCGNQYTAGDGGA